MKHLNCAQPQQHATQHKIRIPPTKNIYRPQAMHVTQHIMICHNNLIQLNMQQRNLTMSMRIRETYATNIRNAQGTAKQKGERGTDICNSIRDNNVQQLQQILKQEPQKSQTLAATFAAQMCKDCSKTLSKGAHKPHAHTHSAHTHTHTHTRTNTQTNGTQHAQQTTQMQQPDELRNLKLKPKQTFANTRKHNRTQARANTRNQIANNTT